MWELLKNPSKEAVYNGLQKAEEYYQSEGELGHYHRLFDKTFILTKRGDIKSSGYIVDTLEAAITGGLVGALYGYDAIPTE